MVETTQLTAEQAIRLDLVKFMIEQDIPAEYLATMVDGAAAVVLGSAKTPEKSSTVGPQDGALPPEEGEPGWSPRIAA